jgi:hypothetical protein
MLTQTERIFVAEKSIDYLLRARKAVRLYPDRNPMTDKAIDDFYHELLKLLSIQDRVAFEIRQDSIMFEMDEVFKAASADSNIAYFLYRDGIREISFRKGLTRDEALGLVNVLSIDFGREAAVEDLGSGIWEQDFRHIRCIIYDPFLSDRSESTFPVKQDSLKAGDLSAELERIYIDAVSKVDETSTMPDEIQLNDEELLLLRMDTDNNRSDRTGKILAISLDLFLLADAKEYSSLETDMKQAVEYALANGKLDVLADFFIRVKAVYMDSSQASDFRRSLANIFSFFSSERFLMRLGAMLDEGMRLKNDTFEKFVQLLGGESTPVLVSLLGYLDTISARKTVVNLLAAVGSSNMTALTDALSDSRWYVVRNMVIVIRRIGDRQVKDHLLQMLDHRDGRVRREAICALAELEGNEAADMLRRALDDTDISVRQCAFGALRNLNAETAKRLLVEKVTGRKFGNMGYAEKREYYSALLRYSDDDVVQLLGRMLLRKSFFRRAANDENRAAIAHCAGAQRVRELLPFLISIENTGSEILQNNVGAAISRIGNEY